MRRHQSPIPNPYSLALCAIVWVAAWTVAAQERPTLVDARLETIAAPRVIHAGRITYAFSPVTGSALFAAEYLTPESLVANVERAGAFRVDPGLPAELRVSPRAYDGTGKDKGHLAPADTHKADQDDQDATFLISNAVPQVPEFNRGLWRQIEQAAKQLVHGDRSAYIVTVPVYDCRTQPVQLVGGVMVPTRIAKVAIVIERGRPIEARAWIAANAVPAAGVTPGDCATTIDLVEGASQLDLFSWLDDETESRMEAMLHGP